jgi:hypothetical protein
MDLREDDQEQSTFTPITPIQSGRVYMSNAAKQWQPADELPTIELICMKEYIFECKQDCR